MDKMSRDSSRRSKENIARSPDRSLSKRTTILDSIEDSLKKLSASPKELKEALNEVRVGFGNLSFREVIASGDLALMKRAEKALRFMAKADPKEKRNSREF